MTSRHPGGSDHDHAKYVPKWSNHDRVSSCLPRSDTCAGPRRLAVAIRASGPRVSRTRTPGLMWEALTETIGEIA
jgi:hypothetical protein